MPTLSRIVFFLLCLLPLFSIPTLAYGFETPKVLLFECVSVMVFLTCLFFGLLRVSKPLLFVLLVGLFLSLTTLFLHSSNTVWFNNPVRLQGLFLQWILFGWMVTISSLPSSPFSPRKLALIALFLLTLSGFFLQDTDTGRAVGLLGEANSFAGSSVLLAVLSCYSLAQEKRKRLLTGLTVLCCLLAVFISGSRSGLLALLIASIVMITGEYSKKIRISGQVLAVGLLCLSLFLPFVSKQSNWDNRTQIWQTAYLAGLNQPITGNGFGNITFSIHKASHLLQNTIEAQFVDSSHNIILDWWVQGGIVGVLLHIGCTVYSLRTFFVRNMKVELVLLLACLEILLFNPVSVYILVVFWWCIGRGFTLQKSSV